MSSRSGSVSSAGSISTADLRRNSETQQEAESSNAAARQSVFSAEVQSGLAGLSPELLQVLEQSFVEPGQTADGEGRSVAADTEATSWLVASEASESEEQPAASKTEGETLGTSLFDGASSLDLSTVLSPRAAEKGANPAPAIRPSVISEREAEQRELQARPLADLVTRLRALWHGGLLADASTALSALAAKASAGSGAPLVDSFKRLQGFALLMDILGGVLKPGPVEEDHAAMVGDIVRILEALSEDTSPAVHMPADQVSQLIVLLLRVIARFAKDFLTRVLLSDTAGDRSAPSIITDTVSVAAKVAPVGMKMGLTAHALKQLSEAQLLERVVAIAEGCRSEGRLLFIAQELADVFCTMAAGEAPVDLPAVLSKSSRRLLHDRFIPLGCFCPGCASAVEARGVVGEEAGGIAKQLLSSGAAEFALRLLHRRLWPPESKRKQNRKGTADSDTDVEEDTVDPDDVDALLNLVCSLGLRGGSMPNSVAATRLLVNVAELHAFIYSHLDRERRRALRTMLLALGAVSVIAMGAEGRVGVPVALAEMQASWVTIADVVMDALQSCSAHGGDAFGDLWGVGASSGEFFGTNGVILGVRVAVDLMLLSPSTTTVLSERTSKLVDMLFSVQGSSPQARLDVLSSLALMATKTPRVLGESLARSQLTERVIASLRTDVEAGACALANGMADHVQKVVAALRRRGVEVAEGKSKLRRRRGDAKEDAQGAEQEDLSSTLVKGIFGDEALPVAMGAFNAKTPKHLLVHLGLLVFFVVTALSIMVSALPSYESVIGTVYSDR
mmetsp:Transcript_30533/g.79032  ORF Transcript_30533/g.79032 Transcript_30533/m.79032 type:complete len:790 (+) Transcript_30533:25-2394(+)